MKKFEYNEVSKEVHFERLNKIVRRKNNKKSFENMSPYEIINYLREKKIRKNFKAFKYNDFYKKYYFVAIIFLVVVVSFNLVGGNEIIQTNIDVFVNKVDDRKEINNALNNPVDYIVEGDFKTLIDGYRLNLNNSFDNHFELAIMLSSINNFDQAKEELVKIKNKINQVTLVKDIKVHSKNVYKLIDSFILINSLDEAKSVIDHHMDSMSSYPLFIQRNIEYLLLNGKSDDASHIYSLMDLSTIEDVESILSYAKLSILFNRVDNAVKAMEKALNKDINNINVLSVIDMTSVYNIVEFNRILNELIQENQSNEVLRLIRARANYKDLSRTKENIEDVFEVIKKYPNSNLPKIVKLDILTTSSRLDEASIIANQLNEIKDKTFDIYYALAKYSLDIDNYNDALNYVKQSISLNKDFGENYFVLLEMLLDQNKSLNVNYFYSKMKLLDPINQNVDRRFVKKYAENFNDIEKAIDILETSTKLSIYESDLRYKLGKIYIDQRKDNEAKEEFYAAINLNQKPIYFRALGVLLIRMGETEEGINNIRKAYNLDSKDILNLNNAAAYYANVEKDVPRAFSNIKAAYENLNDTYTEYEAFIIRENYFKLESIYDEQKGEAKSQDIPFLDYLY